LLESLPYICRVILNTMEKTFKAIDGDNMKLLFTFKDSERESVTEKLNRQYLEVGEDNDGDIIVWED